MLTFFHAHSSRSTAVLALIEELGVAERIRRVDVAIPRRDGSGGRDPANPHPEGKVPALLHQGDLITERGAVMLYLTDLFPEAGLGPRPGEAGRGAYLTWLSWYQGVMEPVIVADYAGLDHPVLHATFRGKAEIAARLRGALDKGPWLLGERFSAADLLCHSPYAWFPDITPDDPLIRDWVARCRARPGVQRAVALDAELAKAA